MENRTAIGKAHSGRQVGSRIAEGIEAVIVMCSYSVTALSSNPWHERCGAQRYELIEYELIVSDPWRERSGRIGYRPHARHCAGCANALGKRIHRCETGDHARN